MGRKSEGFFAHVSQAVDVRAIHARSRAGPATARTLRRHSPLAFNSGALFLCAYLLVVSLQAKGD